MNIPFVLAALSLLILPDHAIASVLDVIDGIDAAPSVGDATFPGIVNFLRDKVLDIIDIIAIFLLVRAGLKLINSQDESKLNSAKTTIGATLVGLMLAHLSNKLVEIFYSGGGVLNPGSSVAMLSTEISGIINWVLSLVAVLGVLMIVVSGVRTISSFGKEDGVTHLKQTVFGTITGIFFIIISGAVKETLGLPAGPEPGAPQGPSTQPIIARGVEIAQQVLDFLVIVAVAVVIYAGFLMIINLGNDEQYGRARGIILRALIGLLVVLLANTIASFVVDLVPGA